MQVFLLGKIAVCHTPEEAGYGPALVLAKASCALATDMTTHVSPPPSVMRSFVAPRLLLGHGSGDIPSAQRCMIRAIDIVAAQGVPASDYGRRRQLEQKSASSSRRWARPEHPGVCASSPPPVARAPCAAMHPLPSTGSAGIATTAQAPPRGSRQTCRGLTRATASPVGGVGSQVHCQRRIIVCPDRALSNGASVAWRARLPSSASSSEDPSGWRAPWGSRSFGAKNNDPLEVLVFPGFFERLSWLGWSVRDERQRWGRQPESWVKYHGKRGQYQRFSSIIGVDACSGHPYTLALPAI